MEWFLPVVLGAIALVFITMPLWAGASNTASALPRTPWHSVEQLEIDRDLGKIDDAEYEELKPEPVAAAPRPSLEALIYGVRRQKRLETTLETEVLIARARQKKPKA